MGWLTRLAYALAGLFFAELALFLCLLVQRAAWQLAGILLPQEFWRGFRLFPMFATVVAMGWMLAAVPLLSVSTRRIPGRLSWPSRLAIGAALGPLTLFLTILLLDRGHVHFRDLLGFRQFWLYSAIASLAGFSAYCRLARSPASR